MWHNYLELWLSIHSPGQPCNENLYISLKQTSQSPRSLINLSITKLKMNLKTKRPQYLDFFLRNSLFKKIAPSVYSRSIVCCCFFYFNRNMYLYVYPIIDTSSVNSQNIIIEFISLKICNSWSYSFDLDSKLHKVRGDSLVIDFLIILDFLKPKLVTLCQMKLDFLCPLSPLEYLFEFLILF